MSDIKPDYQASIDFLQQWLPRGPWVLVAIDPNEKGLDADIFGGADLSQRLPEWLEKQGTKLKRNIYFTDNPCFRNMTTKPSREHIQGLSWLHVDLDPRAGESLPEEQERILSLLKDPSSKGIPKPTAIVFSGGGYQGFWRLTVPEPLDGTAEMYEEAKCWNKQLELTLGGDNCHNVDRIMRLPGTINRPDARKRAKKRVDALAKRIEFNDIKHDLAKFTKAPQVAWVSPGFSGGTVTVSGNLARFAPGIGRRSQHVQGRGRAQHRVRTPDRRGARAGRRGPPRRAAPPRRRWRPGSDPECKGRDDRVALDAIRQAPARAGPLAARGVHAAHPDRGDRPADGDEEAREEHPA